MPAHTLNKIFFSAEALENIGSLFIHGIGPFKGNGAIDVIHALKQIIGSLDVVDNCRCMEKTGLKSQLFLWFRAITQKKNELLKTAKVCIRCTEIVVMAT